MLDGPGHCTQFFRATLDRGNAMHKRKTATLAMALIAPLAMHAGVAAAQGKSPSAQMARGQYLVNGIAACGNCHSARNEKGEVIEGRGLSGGMPFDAPVFRAFAQN